MAACLAVEAFKLTGLPARYGNVGAVRWLLGTTPSWHNIACYIVSVVAVTTVDVCS